MPTGASGTVSRSASNFQPGRNHREGMNGNRRDSRRWRSSPCVAGSLLPPSIHMIEHQTTVRLACQYAWRPNHPPAGFQSCSRSSFGTGSVSEASSSSLRCCRKREPEYTEYRGAGIGGELLNRLVEAGREIGVQRFKVYSASRYLYGAMRFYRCHGFESYAQSRVRERCWSSVRLRIIRELR